MIPDLRRWNSRGHCEIKYYLTQALTGHGGGGVYLCSFKISNHHGCGYRRSVGGSLDRKNSERVATYTPEVESLVDSTVPPARGWDVTERVRYRVLRDVEITIRIPRSDANARGGSTIYMFGV